MPLLRLNSTRLQVGAIALAGVLSLSGWAQNAQSGPSAARAAGGPSGTITALRPGGRFETALRVPPCRGPLPAGLRATAQPE